MVGQVLVLAYASGHKEWTKVHCFDNLRRGRISGSNREMTKTSFSLCDNIRQKTEYDCRNDDWAHKLLVFVPIVL